MKQIKATNFRIILFVVGMIAIVEFGIIMYLLSYNTASPIESSSTNSTAEESQPDFYGASPVQPFIDTFSNKSEPYLYGVPPAPPFREIELTIYNEVSDGCYVAANNLVGYIIDVREKDESFDLYLTLIIQDENGVRHKCYLDRDRACYAVQRELPYILIPGNKVEMKVEECGNGGFINIMHLKSLRRV